MTDIYLYSHIPTLREHIVYGLEWAKFVLGNYCYLALYASRFLSTK